MTIFNICIFSKVKEDEDFNHRNILKYFEDKNFRLTQRLGKIAILGQPSRHVGKATVSTQVAEKWNRLLLGT